MFRPPDTEFVEMFGRHQADFWEMFSKISSRDVSDFLHWKSDFPHGEFHRKQVAVYANQVARQLGLPESEIKTCLYAGMFHDLGRNRQFVEKFKGGEDKHSVASLIGAYLIRHESVDSEISSFTALSDAIAHHSDDVLPKDAPLTTRIVRDCDRVAGMGWSGIIRDAYYLGFRHPRFTRKTQAEVAEDISICDMGNTWDDNYEIKVREFVLENVLPFIMEKGKMHEMLHRCSLWIWRYTGVEDNSGQPIVDPIMFDIQAMFLRRHMATVEFADILLGQISPRNILKMFQIVDKKYHQQLGGSPKYLDRMLYFARKHKMLWGQNY
jgi:hypothetical protein